ncbi:hypothetical protein F4861DRAFT_449494 [Xylaria intraflava]|nr:hypothetical protein F4861DRAFT_449494 [Xylaria intraflava]
MATRRVPPAPLQPDLRRDIDMQLEKAWFENQWTTVANLARKRYRATKDEYFKAVEVAAVSCGDNPVDRTTGRELVQTLISEGKTVKDIAILSLYEFAIDGLGMDFSKTIGVLFVRLVKSFPRDIETGLECFYTCMKHTDWEHAQEIAVSLNKSLPGGRQLLFNNIMATSLVARGENVPENKRKLFANLAKAQIDRAFNLRAVNGKENAPLSRADFSQSGVMLWLDIRRRFGSAQETLELLSQPHWNPLFFLEHGFSRAFDVSLLLLAHNGQSEELVRLGNILLDRVISLGKRESSKDKTPNGRDHKDGSLPSLLDDAIRERYVNAVEAWENLVTIMNAAGKIPTARKALKVFHKKFETVARIVRSEGNLKGVDELTFAQLFLELSFVRVSLATSTGANVQTLLKLARGHFTHTGKFSMLKSYIKTLSDEKQIVEFVHALQDEGAGDSVDTNAPDKLVCFALGLRVKFLQATSLQGKEECQFCHSSADGGPDCNICIKSIAQSALATFHLALQNKDFAENDPHNWKDLVAGLAILGSICLLKLAGLGHKPWRYKQESPLYDTNIQLFLQAVVWLDFCRRKGIHTNSLAVMLVKLYLIMGCLSSAFSLWHCFDIKNSLHECLHILVIDRLASISPARLVPGPTNFVAPILDYFEIALRKRGPAIMIEALRCGNYVEFEKILWDDNSRSRNSVMVLGVLEARRGTRIKTGRADRNVEEDVLIGSLTPDSVLLDTTDYSIFPDWHGPGSMPVQELVSYGPLPTSARCHMGILAERFLDLVCYVPSRDYKPLKSNQLQLTDCETAFALFKTVQERLNALVYDQSAEGENGLTDPERWYFRLVDALAELVMRVLEDILAASSTESTKARIHTFIERAVKILEYQIDGFLNVPDGIVARMPTLHGVSALHAMGMLRESSVAAKHTAQYLTMVLERTKSKDKSRGTGGAAWLPAELKKLSATAAVADKQMKARVKKLTDNVATGGWVDRLSDWAFSDNTAYRENDGDFPKSTAKLLGEFVTQADRETWANDVADSWRQNMKDWSAVKFD